MKKIIRVLLISINDYSKINHQNAFSFLIFCLALDMFTFSNVQIKANL